jgi:hypothetical protein
MRGRPCGGYPPACAEIHHQRRRVYARDMRERRDSKFEVRSSENHEPRSLARLACPAGLARHAVRFRRLWKTSRGRVRVLLVHTSRTIGEHRAGCSKRPDFSPAQPWRLLHPPALSLPRQPLSPGTRLAPGKAATSEEAKRRRGEEVQTALRMGRSPYNGSWRTGKPLQCFPTSKELLLHLELLSDARTLLRDLFSILLAGPNCLSARR